MGVTLAGAQAAGPYVPDPADVREFLISGATYAPTPRFLDLDRKEAFFRTLEYQHQSLDWWGRNADDYETISPRVTLPQGFVYGDPQADVFVRDRRPTAPLRMARAIVDRFTGMLLSAGRKPVVQVPEDPSTEDALNAVIDSSNFWAQMRGARSLGGAVGSVLVTVHLREGKYQFEVHNTKNIVNVVWADRRSWTPLGVLKMYSYGVPEDVRDKDGKVVGSREVAYLYRRIITAHEDVVYKPVRLDLGGSIPWEPDPALAVKHDLGFFPGVWIQNTTDSEDMDGDPDCEGAWQMIDTVDRLVAQVNKGALSNVDPTLWLAYDQTKMGDKTVKTGSDTALHLPEGGQANYLVMGSEAVRITMEYIEFLRRRVQDLTRCVLMDPEKISGAAQSAKAIEYLFAPTIERTDDFREQYGRGFRDLLRIVHAMALRFQGKTLQIGVSPQGVPVLGAFQLALPPKITRVREGDRERVVVTPVRFGPGGTINLAWGAYFATTEADDMARVTTATSAKSGGLVTQETATRHVSRIFDVEDPEAEAARAAEESAADAERALAGFDGGLRPTGLEP